MRRLVLAILFLFSLALPAPAQSIQFSPNEPTWAPFLPGPPPYQIAGDGCYSVPDGCTVTDIEFVCVNQRTLVAYSAPAGWANGVWQGFKVVQSDDTYKVHATLYYEDLEGGSDQIDTGDVTLVVGPLGITSITATNTLPDSRLKHRDLMTKMLPSRLSDGRVVNIEHVPTFCFVCGKKGGYLPASCTWASFLYPDCANNVGHQFDGWQHSAQWVFGSRGGSGAGAGSSAGLPGVVAGPGT